MSFEDVSVIIAAYNDETYIADCLCSVLEAHAAEIIVVNDASTDGTLSQIAKISASNLKVVNLTSNLGPSSARNTGLALAKHRYCAIVDADDIIHKNRLKVMLDLMKKTSATIILDDLVAFDNDTGNVIRRQLDAFPMQGRYQQITATDMIRYDLGSLKPLLDMRSVRALGVLYPEHTRYGEDFLFLLEILKKGGKLFATRATQYRLRRNTEQRLTSNRYKLFSRLLCNELQFHTQYSWSLQEHVQLFRRHARNTLGLGKSALKILSSRK